MSDDDEWAEAAGDLAEDVAEHMPWQVVVVILIVALVWWGYSC